MNFPSNSVIVTHKQCPRCAERGNDNHEDNLGVYSDGHCYCFACGFYVPVPNSVQSLTQRLSNNNSSSSAAIGDMGNLTDYNEYFLHCTTILPLKALQWLGKYGITQLDASIHGVYYDQESDLLVFPILSEGEVQEYKGYNARNFSGVGPKYISKGNLKDYPQYLEGEHANNNITIFTEDFVSAMKVSRQYIGVPLFGTKLHHHFLNPVVDTNIFILWLDFDKAKESIKQTRRLQQFFPNVFSLITKKDPKEYSDKEINAFVFDCIARST